MGNSFVEAKGLPPITGIERDVTDEGNVMYSARVTLRRSPNLVVINVWDFDGRPKEIALSRTEIRRICKIVDADEFPDIEDAEADIQEVIDTLAEDNRENFGIV